MVRYLIVFLLAWGIALGCAARETTIDVTHPSGAKGSLTYKEDSRQCAKNMDCKKDQKDE